MKKYTTLVLCATLLSLFPSGAIGAGALSAKDTVAGIGAEVVCAGCPPGAALAVRIAPPLGATVTVRGVSDERGEATLRIPGEETQIAGPYAAELEGTGVRTTFSVLPEGLDERESGMEADRTRIAADGTDEARITVILRDRYGNLLDARPVQLVSSRPEDRIRALTSQSDAEGQQMFALTTRNAGTASLRAIDLLSGKPLEAHVSITAGDAEGDVWTGGQGGDASGRNDGWNSAQGAIPVGEFRGRTLYGQVTDGFDVIDHFAVEIEGGGTAVPIRQDVTFRVTAQDRDGRTVEDYTGTIRFSSTDPKAILPFGTRQFAAKDLGVKNFTLGLRFNTGGEQTLAVEDTSGSVRGSATVTITGGVAPQEQAKISVTTPAEGSTVNMGNVIVKGTAPPLINLLVTGGTEIARGDTDGNGNFQVPVTLPSGQTGAVLQVEEATGKFKSNPLHLRIDLTGPRIRSVEFSPRTPAEGQSTEVTVLAEPMSAPVTLALEGNTVPLTEDPQQPGTFKGSFPAPSKTGNYQPLVTALDAIGNKSEMLASFIVKQKTPPVVQNLAAQAKVNAVALRWDAVEEGTADTYRVYVGETPENFAYSLDTDTSVSAATVAGLQQGQTYFFAVTALKDSIESAEKSAVADATVLGIRLSVTPGDTSLLLQWNSVKRTTPLAAYLLEYGIAPDQLSEKRIISGDADSYTLRDLINGVTYRLRLTPISVPGEMLKDLATLAQGTPNGAGFHPVAGSGTQFIAEDLPPPPPTSVVKSGMPPVTWGILFTSAAALVFVLLHFQRRRSLRMTEDFMRNMQQRYRL